jgi:peroxidase
MPSSLNIWFVLVVSISVLISWTSPIGESGKSSAPSAPGVSSVTLASSFDDELSLDFDFYRETCPQAEAIVRSSMARIYSEHQDVSAALLRLFFHDCFIEVSGPFPSFILIASSFS